MRIHVDGRYFFDYCIGPVDAVVVFLPSQIDAVVDRAVREVVDGPDKRIIYANAGGSVVGELVRIHVKVSVIQPLIQAAIHGIDSSQGVALGLVKIRRHQRIGGDFFQ